MFPVLKRIYRATYCRINRGSKSICLYHGILLDENTRLRWTCLARMDDLMTTRPLPNKRRVIRILWGQESKKSRNKTLIYPHMSPFIKIQTRYKKIKKFSSWLAFVKFHPNRSWADLRIDECNMVAGHKLSGIVKWFYMPNCACRPSLL